MLRDQMADLVSENGMKSSVSALLPTVVTTDASGSRNSTSNRADGSKHHSGQTLTDVLLPTPTTREHKDGQAQVIRDGKVQTDTVARAVINSGEVTPVSWGKFAPAIQRWEQVTGRKAPSPTKPDGKDGNHRLSSEFTEWMMGLESGWITNVGLTRNEELKACGNGVVPQQAVLALRHLLDGTPIPDGGGACESANSNSLGHFHGQPFKHTTNRWFDALCDASSSSEKNRG